MAPIRQSLAKKLEALGAQFGPEIAAAFRQAISEITNTIILADLVAAIEAGDVVRAVKTIGLSLAALRPIIAAIERSFETGGATVAATFPRLRDPITGGRAIFRFDLRNSRAEAWLRDHSSALVTRVSEETRINIQTILNEGMQAGENPRNVALNIAGRMDATTGRRTGGIIGLNGPQERAVANARIELTDPATISNYFTRERRDKRFDGVVAKAINAGETLPPETVNRLVNRYSDRLLLLRGETIGRTEALASLNRSQHEAFQQAVDTGSVKQSAVKRIWDSTGNDGRTRDSHLDMEGQTVGMDEPFTTPSGAQLMFPGDSSLGAGPEETINCRCKVKFQVDFLADVATNGPPE